MNTYQTKVLITFYLVCTFSTLLICLICDISISVVIDCPELTDMPSQLMYSHGVVLPFPLLKNHLVGEGLIALYNWKL